MTTNDLPADMPDAKTEKRLKALRLIRRLGFTWSNDAQVYYDIGYRMAPMSGDQAMALSNAVSELIKNNQEEK